jgi:hypothetical protein
VTKRETVQAVTDRLKGLPPYKFKIGQRVIVLGHRCTIVARMRDTWDLGDVINDYVVSPDNKTVTLPGNWETGAACISEANITPIRKRR